VPLSVDVVSRIADLELAARLVVEGLRTGGERSPFLGVGAEFRQHRAYQAGDDLKHVDWKVSARHDRLLTRQLHETTNASVLLVLDTSASMAYPAGPHHKFRYAQVAAAALAWVAGDQGHAVGLLTTVPDPASAAGARFVYRAPRAGPLARRQLLAALAGLTPAGRWPAARTVARASALLRRRGVLVVLSDFYDDEEAVRRVLREAARRGHDVRPWQLVAPEERALPAGGALELEDLETGGRQLVDAASLGAAYGAAHAAFLARWRTGARRDGLAYAELDTRVPPARALRDALRGTSGVASAGGATPAGGGAVRGARAP
jgi:uncharacterized protein (DUF58 family)